MADPETIFIKRAEEVIIELKDARRDLEKVKTWYKASSLTFFIATIALIGSIYVNNHRLNSVESEMDNAASIKGVELLSQLHQAEVVAIGELITDADKKATLKGFQSVIKSVNENIFAYSMSITRGIKNDNTETR